MVGIPGDEMNRLMMGGYGVMDIIMKYGHEHWVLP